MHSGMVSLDINKVGVCLSMHAKMGLSSWGCLTSHETKLMPQQVVLQCL